MNLKSVSRFQPSGLNSKFQFGDQNFADYIESMTDVVRRARCDLNSDNAEKIIQANAPQQWLPEKDSKVGKVTKDAEGAKDANETKASNSTKYKKGVFLIHCLLESPYTIHSLFEYFKSKNFLVRSILLPSHFGMIRYFHCWIGLSLKGNRPQNWWLYQPGMRWANWKIR